MISRFKNRKGLARHRVAHGAQWLDEQFPGWENRINPRTLDLANANSCICGQVFEKESRLVPGFQYATRNLFAEASGWISAIVKMPADGENGVPLFGSEAKDRSAKVSVALGFQKSGFVSYARLQKEWVKLLKIRAAAPTPIAPDETTETPLAPLTPDNVVEVAERILAHG